MEGINSPFTLYDHSGKSVSGEVKTGFFIKIELPGIKLKIGYRLQVLKTTRSWQGLVFTRVRWQKKNTLIVEGGWAGFQKIK